MYLIEGKEKAALIDTGVGVGDLKPFIRELTDKPLIVLVTHGHVDHALGAVSFDEVYMSHIDETVYNIS
jgi:glyoxylase-like metal-dependent hydrolase (beta-lactamase superfamily II)